MTRKPPFLSKYALAFKILTVTAIFAVLLTRINWDKMMAQLQSIDLTMSSIALALVVFQIGMLAYRWQIFMNTEKKLVSFPQSFNIITTCQLANSLFITSVGGIIVRIAMAQYYGMSLLKSLCAVITDRFMTLFSIVAFSILFIPTLLPILPVRLIESVIAIIVMLLAAVLIFPSMLINVFKPIILKNRPLASTIIYLRHMLRKPNLWVPVLVSSLLAQLFFFLSVCFAAQSIGVTFNVLHMLAILPMITVLASLPLGLGGWGVREGAFAFGLGLIQIDLESALLISVQIGILGILSVVVAAIPGLFTGSLQFALRKAGTYALSKRN